MQPKKHLKTNSRPNWAVWTVFVNSAHWRGSTLAVWNSSHNIPSISKQSPRCCQMEGRGTPVPRVNPPVAYAASCQ